MKLHSDIVLGVVGLPGKGLSPDETIPACLLGVLTHWVAHRTGSRLSAVAVAAGQSYLLLGFGRMYRVGKSCSPG